MGAERNYARFYGLLKKLPGADKETLVYCTTCGRTTSLREKLMQQAGIDTTDWQRINDFCRHPRIAGKEFARLTLEELDSLQTKLRSIMRKGGLKPKPSRDDHRNTTSFVYVPMGNIAES